MNKEINVEIDISNKLKTCRRNSSLSQEGLAETSGISIRTIQRIEKGLSIGSAYTLNALAKALNVNTSDLISQQHLSMPLLNDNRSQLKLLNLSAISILLVPLSNIIVPAIIFFNNRNDKAINNYGRKILSFQILWTLSALLIMLVLPIVLLFLFPVLSGSRMPLFIPVYFICVIINVHFIIRFAISLNNQSHLIEKIPNIL